MGCNPSASANAPALGPEQIKFGSPVELIPPGEQRFAVTQFGFPLLPPIGAQASWHDHADCADQPEPETKPCCGRHVIHQLLRILLPPHSGGEICPATRAGERPTDQPWSLSAPERSRPAARRLSGEM